ncbi:MAG: iron-containing alcohol dehydrogenase [Anaeromyxobacter sp.]
MVSFELHTPARIVFGAGKAAEAPAEVAALGVRRALLVTGRTPARAAALQAGLEARGLVVIPFRVAGEPTVASVLEGVALAAGEKCDGVVAIGGGSALDAGKAVAGLAGGANPYEHLEVVGKGLPLQGPVLPLVALPTTAGTGSEVTRNAVLGVPEAGVKVSLRSPLLLPRVAVVDPDLLAGAPRSVMASSGLDAFTQVLEPYLSARANPFTDALAADGIRRSARALRRAVLDGPDAAAREDLALTSLFGGLCLANAGLGAVHGFAGPAGGMLDAPHGALCAALLVPCLEVNLAALRARAPAHPALARLAEVAAWLTGRPLEAPEEGIAWIAGLCRALGVRGLASLGLPPAEVPALVARARAASSMKANPVALTEAELTLIAERALADA